MFFLFMKSLTVHEFEQNLQNVAGENRREPRKTEERTEENQGTPKGSGGDLHTTFYDFLLNFIEHHTETKIKELGEHKLMSFNETSTKHTTQSEVW